MAAKSPKSLIQPHLEKYLELKIGILKDVDIATFVPANKEQNRALECMLKLEDEICKIFYPYIRIGLKRKFPNYPLSSVEDAVQDAAVEICQCLRKYDPEHPSKAAFMTWATTNMINSLYKTFKKESTLDHEELTTDIPYNNQAENNEHKLLVSMENLEPIVVQIIELISCGWTYIDIMFFLQISEHEFRSYLKTARIEVLKNIEDGF